MKAILEFDLNSVEDREDHEKALKASSLAAALFETRQQVFRPARKHGYSDEALQNLNEREVELIGLLESKFSEICQEYGVDEYT